MAEQKIQIRVWETSQGQQCDSPDTPRLPWYSPFRSEQVCRQVAAKGDLVAADKVRLHEAGKNRR